MKGMCSIWGCDGIGIEVFRIKNSWCQTIPPSLLTDEQGVICMRHFEKSQFCEHILEAENGEIYHFTATKLKTSAVPTIFDSCFKNASMEISPAVTYIVNENESRTGEGTSSYQIKPVSSNIQIPSEGLPNVSEVRDESDGPTLSGPQLVPDNFSSVSQKCSEKNNSNSTSLLKKRSHECKYCPQPAANSPTTVDKYLGIEEENLKINKKPEKPFSCEECPETFSSVLKLKLHIAELHREKEYKCSMCSKKFAKPHSLAAHQNKHLNKPAYQCETCSQVFSHPNHLRRHRFRKHEGKILHSCHVCGKGFVEKYSFLYHLIVHHTEHWFYRKDGKMHCCNLCEKQGTRKDKIVQHALTEHKYDILNICRFCDTFFTSKELLAEHIETNHDASEQNTTATRSIFKSAKQNFTCPVCGKKFFCTKGNFDYHVQAHSSLFLCDICARTFKHKYLLTEHIDFVHLKKVKPCKVCQKQFSGISQLNQHMLIHSDERPFLCDVCGQGFRTTCNLKKHRLTHLSPDKRSHKCNLCDKAFNIPYLLREHQLAHSGMKPFKCDLCGLGFREKRQVKRHKTKMHDTEMELS